MNEPNVNINMSGLDFRQDVEPLIKEFFPLLYNEAGEVTVDFELYEDEMTLSVTGPGGRGCSRSLESEGRAERGSLSVSADSPACRITETFSSEEEKPKLRHRAYRNQLLRALYRLLSEYTGKRLPWGTLTGVRPTKLIFERLERGEAKHLQFMDENYYVSKEKAALATRIAAVEYKLLDALDYKKGYSLYVGIPFCPSICNYCSFGSHPIDRFNDCVEPYLEALKKEIRAVSACFPDRVLQTVYFGGGTPTSISAEQLRGLIRCVKESFDFEGVREFTVEAGRPDSITRDKLQVLLDEGVTRISINPQSMVGRTLETIGRRHSAEQVREAFVLARSLGFDNINMDLIAGLTGEDINDFRYTLSELEKLDPDSVTVHTLARKRAARLTTEGELYEGNEAKDVELMVDTAAGFMKEHGYEPYYLYRQKNMSDNLENVGYAKPGKEGLYNILIMEEKQIILACGSGASSKFVRDAGDKRFERVENVKNVHDYIDRIDEMIARKLDYIAEHGIR